MNKKINIVAVIIAVLFFIGYYFDLVAIYFIVILAFAYITVNVIGIVNIKYNYFFYSHCKANTTIKQVAITFDDGPHPDITSKLIDLLDSKEVTSAFFCPGKNADLHPEIITKLTNSNHIIGNHSYSHSFFFDFFSSAKMRKEIYNTNKIIQQITGKTPLLFRPPYGITNPLLRRALKKTNMISIGWSLRSLDTVKSSEKVLAKLKAKTKAGDIILFHDTNPDIVSIIESYITWLEKNDFKIVSLTKLLNIKAYANQDNNN